MSHGLLTFDVVKNEFSNFTLLCFIIQGVILSYKHTTQQNGKNTKARKKNLEKSNQRCRGKVVFIVQVYEHTVYFESQQMIRNNVQAAITAERISVSRERLLLIEPIELKKQKLLKDNKRLMRLVEDIIQRLIEIPSKPRITGNLSPRFFTFP